MKSKASCKLVSGFRVSLMTLAILVFVDVLIIPASTVLMLARITVTANSPRWSKDVYSPLDHKRYTLWLFPEYDVSGHLLALELIANSAGVHSADVNLLSPKRWMGNEPWLFHANAWLPQSQDNPFGPERTMKIEGSRMSVRVKVLGGKAGEPSANTSKQDHAAKVYYLDEIQLSISVEE